jgi:nucleotide-binding universal stress UspA family protein
MFESILVPLDGSRVGEAAIPVIRKLVEKCPAQVHVEITLLGAITILRHWVVVGEASAPVSYTEDELKLIKERVQNYLEKAGEALQMKQVIVKTMVSTGNAAEEILKAADKLKVDVIAMSTHGRSGLRRLVLGSITDKVLRGAGVPVLLVRAPEGTTNE